MEVQEICRKLKPILGAKADRYWLAYLSEDADGKRELEIILNMLMARHLGSDVENQKVYLSPPSSDIAAGEYPVGNVIYNEKELHAFGIREHEWIQHTAIFGRSGAGKTNTVFLLIENLLNHKKPFLIFDWKRNYRDLLAVGDDDVLVYTVGRDIVPFSFNPLIPPAKTDPSTWLKKLIEIIAHAYYVGEGVMYLLQEGLHAVYQEFGVYDGVPDKYPTFEDVLNWLENNPAKGRKAMWMDSAMRGVKSICFGHMGAVVNTAKQPNIAEMLTKNIILELDSLTDQDKTLIIESLLLWIHHYRLSQPDRETFKHAMIIEEAHHILLKRTGAGSGGEAITDTILREIRELGEAIVLIDQHPSLISVPAMGNTYTTIALNVKHLSDVNALGGAMLLDDEQKDLIGRLPIGQAIVKLQGRWLQPFLVKIPHRKIPKGAVDDTALIQLMTARNIIKPYQKIIEEEENEKEKKDKEIKCEELSEREKEFLMDVLKNPFFGVVERYKSLNLSRRKGNTIRESLIEKGILATTDITIKSGKTVLTELTAKGRNALQKLGYEVSDKSRWGGLEHEYWKSRVAEKFRNEGWQVKIEEPVNGFTDIIAEKEEVAEKREIFEKESEAKQNENRIVAIEIETGKSDWQANIEKNVKKGITEIVIIATNADACRKISEDLENNKKIEPGTQIWIEQAHDFV